ncbi:MAG: flap endonuclease-1 [Nitrosopumilus sp.]|nr:flap endonuclease-1 [Nitrosopumilus sp.]CAI9831535.1 Flap endonuclease 1 [Nitrosopumilaceae archaeon]MDA7940818.1 flap endonuclease-1 [Nitrosopumilus sp.]MDA7943026.1 flap endonuclease-1 [Nitrosopumilus sp.]MDA7944563.1 flap endonuclease-1 [Nitrosopumilus sp.]
MGLNLRELVSRERTDLAAFSSRVVAIDAYNAIYQFLAGIRGPGGEPLTDTRGRTTSHLSGLFYRNLSFLAKGIRPVYVFDGRPPSLKSAEIARRRSLKRDAAAKYERAVSEGDQESARKYAQQTTSLEDGMIPESKKILGLLGIPCVDAPSEGEATAAAMTRQGTAYAAASQDFDSVLFGAARLARNFTNGGRRRVPGRGTYIEAPPEIIDSTRTLATLGITREQLVDVGILIGTDFNPGGFARIGPKTAIKLVKRHGRLEEIPKISLEGTDYVEIRRIFLEPEVAEPEIEHGPVDRAGLVSYLASRDFSEERASQALAKLEGSQRRRSQSLDQWL